MLETSATDKPPIPIKGIDGRGGARPGAGRPKKSPDSADPYSILAKAKAKHETYKAHLSELEYKRQAGELLPVDEVAEAWANQVAIAKGRFLALPSRVSTNILRLKSQREIETLLREAIIVILEELANGQE